MKYCRAVSRWRPVVRGTKGSGTASGAGFLTKLRNSESKALLSRHYRAMMDRNRGAERMSNGSRPDALLRQFEDLFTAGAVGGLSDGELLERFLQDRSAAGEAAFRRWWNATGPWFCGFATRRSTIATRPRMRSRRRFWCWRGRRARSASVVRWRAGCSEWPAGPRRGFKSRRHADVATSARARHDWRFWAPQSEASESWPELHAEVERLPEKYRVPIVLCYFEGLTHEQAASLLQWPVGTVKIRLSRAREQLRTRLERRGWTSVLDGPGQPAPA